jgi:hypothetical protein
MISHWGTDHVNAIRNDVALKLTVDSNASS